MNKKENEITPRDFLNELRVIERLLILLIDKQGVDKRDIAKALGISQGRLSQILNPKKYK